MTSTRPDHNLVATDPDEDMWRKALSALRFYLDSCGSADVPRSARARGIRLGQWVHRCREDYWLDVLCAEHSADLEAVEGWSWGLPPHRPRSWRHAFTALAHYAAEHNTTVLAAHTTFDGVDLQAWAAAQRLSRAESWPRPGSTCWRRCLDGNGTPQPRGGHRAWPSPASTLPATAALMA